MTPPEEHTGKSGYLIGSLIILVSVVAGITLFVFGVIAVSKAFTFPQEVSSNNEVEITKVGNYIVYEIQYSQVGNSVTTNRTAVDVSRPGGARVFTSPYSFDRNVTRGSDTATAIATFRADTTGTYRVVSTSAPSGTRFAVGDGAKVRFGMLVSGILVGAGGFLIGVIILIVTAVRRRRDRPMPAMPGGGYPPQSGYLQQPSPYGSPPGPYGQPPTPYGPPPGPYGQPPTPYGQQPTPYGDPSQGYAPPGPPDYGQAPAPTWPSPQPASPLTDDPTQSGWASPS